MPKYCDQCGEKIEDEGTSFCPQCGNQLQSETKNEKTSNLLIYGIIGVVIILIVSIVIVSGGFVFFDQPASTANNTATVNTTTEIDSQVTSTNTEPDYESFSYSNSFEETDRNGDGYVTLSDMNIAHTPIDITNQMYADSDSDGDGRLNYHEYYKFMYKLNYDRDSYGL